jgi:four helix bundle protein
MEEHPTSNIQHPTSNGQEATSSGQEPTSNGQEATSGGQEITSNGPETTNEMAGGEVWEFREGEGAKRRFDLEERLLEFASAVIDLSENLPDTRAGNHVAGQVLRSGTSPYPNHGEAEDAESRDDFIHKLKVCLKELRETRRWARLIKRKGWAKEDPTQVFVLSEADELIRIFYSSVQTAKRNALADKRPGSRPIGNPPSQTG